jgi:hypothetical protein
MNFTEFWSMQSPAAQTVPKLREMAKSAWDSALCAVQNQIFATDGKLLPAEEIASTISRAHTWNESTKS